ncbi:ICMT-domain-containing protein [Tilletiaria anomala UBC 951]|uniref:Protein-S-isoprenylcysteine O-methyltransferase n=1 Tax=Tilletiaria anomala (strain ATCC 24038 / CBS 436.72 / UBC 951) TaxID=1037660 RepID=A0A066VWY3_TILAU|nr:ICMT-domain-containing protein [Tilletiaria anomala UBC 951]KDN43304.1 ICMT-domain-containing protein [Tilletiaria anomala UBC 951]
MSEGPRSRRGAVAHLGSTSSDEPSTAANPHPLHASTPAVVANGRIEDLASLEGDKSFDGRLRAARQSLPAEQPKTKVPFWSPSTTPPIPPYLADQVLTIAVTSIALGILWGFVLPRALQVFAFRNIRQSGAAWAENLLKTLARPQLHLYFLSWSTFHILEFVITAKYNNTRLYDDSFLLNNGLAYYLAHFFGLVEFCIESLMIPHRKVLCGLTYLGVALILVGHAARSLAMVHASSNFSHSVAWRKRPDHSLVTHGIYSISRHPSYFGFFAWALGTQLLLANPVGICLFTVVLWRFFSHRIHVEEMHLVEFFGDEYIAYKSRVGTLLPFIA